MNIPEQTLSSVREVRLGVEVTTQCNIRCPHCFARSGISKDATLSVDVVKEVVAEGYETGYRHLHLTGGEPLLWEGLLEVVGHAFGLGFETVLVNTNGTLLTQELSRRLATYDGLSISVSLEGTEDLHERLRGKGSYRRTIRGLEEALDAGLDPILFTAACKSLIPELPRLADGVYKRFPGIRYLTLIQLTGARNDAFPLDAELLEPEGYLQVVRMVALLNLYGLRIHVLNDPLVNVAAGLLEMPWIPQSYSLYRQGSMFIMANQTIGLSHSGRESFGKYESGMIGRVLASGAYRKAVAPDSETCPSCEHSARCTEKGLVRPSENYRDTNLELPYCKRVLETVALYASPAPI